MDRHFWDSLARKHGTTGFTDYSIAFYDQLMRLKCVEQVIRQHGLLNDPRQLSLLDFGCGSGDFLAYFADRFGRLVGYDVSESVLEIAKKRLAGVPHVTLVSSLKELDTKFNVVLSITVLQHILGEAELDSTLEELSTLCSVGAYFVALESVEVNMPSLRQPHHVRPRSLERWKGALGKVGFQVESVLSFYNPYLIPTPSLQRYIKSVSLSRYLYRLLRGMRINPTFLNEYFRSRAERVVSGQSNCDGLVAQDSFAKIFVAKKTS